MLFFLFSIVPLRSLRTCSLTCASYGCFNPRALILTFSLSSPLDMPSLLSPFRSNDSRTRSALREVVLERFTADAILIRKNSDSQSTSGKERESEESEKKTKKNKKTKTKTKKTKKKGVRGHPLPFSDYVGHAGYLVKATFNCSTVSIRPNLEVIADIVLKRKLLQTFSVITV